MPPIMAGASVLFLGTGDAFCNGGRLHTAFHVAADGYQALIDCGATTIAVMRHLQMDVAAIDAIVVSHLHGDHFGGIPFLILDGQFRRRERDLTIAGPPGTQQRVEQAMELMFPGSLTGRRRFELRFAELGANATDIGAASVSSIEVEQPDTPACALRVEYGGCVVAYTGDTAWTDDLIGLAKGADLLIAEAYFFDREVPYHLDYTTLQKNAGRLDCKRILLTHMSPDMLARAGEADFETAYDGMVVELDPTKT
jgi:ribonuclease BN (tRNA processing enzyme)